MKNKPIGAPRPLALKIGETDLRAVLKPYTAEMLRELWRRMGREDDGSTSGDMWDHLVQDYPGKKGSISRSSVIFELNNLVGLGVLTYHERTGKGGYHRRYRAVMTKEDFWIWITRQACETLFEASNMPDLFKNLNKLGILAG